MSIAQPHGSQIRTTYSLVFVALEAMVAGYDLHRCYGTPYGTVLEAQLIDRNHTDEMLIE